MDINFETGGDYEIRGWEYTWPYWYDSPPDFDLTLHGFWAFVDSVLLSNGIRDHLRNTLNMELQRRLEDELTSEDLRRRVEDELDRNIVAPAMARLGIRRLLGVRVMGNHMEIHYQR